MTFKTIDFQTNLWVNIKHMNILQPQIGLYTSDLGMGYVVPASYNGTIISQKALILAQKINDILFYPEGPLMNLVEYELLNFALNQGNISNDEDILTAQAKMLELNKIGYIDLPDYFGEYPIPRNSSKYFIEETLKISNGMYFSISNDNWYFCICEVIADSELSNEQLLNCDKCDDYYFLLIENFNSVILDLINSISTTNSKNPDNSNAFCIFEKLLEHRKKA